MRNYRSVFVMILIYASMLMLFFSCTTVGTITNKPEESVYSGYSGDYYQEEITDRDTDEFTDGENEEDNTDGDSFMPVIDFVEDNAEIQDEEPGYSLKSLLSGETDPVPVMVDRSSAVYSDGLSITSDDDDVGYDMLREYMKSIEQSKPVTEPVSVANPAFINHDAEISSDVSVEKEEISPVESSAAEEKSPTFIYVPEEEKPPVVEAAETVTVRPEPVMDMKKEDLIMNTYAENEIHNDVVDSSANPVDFYNSGKNYWNSNYSVDRFKAQDEARKQAEKESVETEHLNGEEKEEGELYSYYSPDVDEPAEPVIDDSDKKIAVEAAQKDGEFLRNFDFRAFFLSWEGISCIVVPVLFIVLLVVIRIKKKNR